MVGFQTKLRHPSRCASSAPFPGSRKAEFARLGGLHRNTFINAPASCSTRALAPARRAAPALCRADHRLRRLRGIGGHWPPCRPLRGGGERGRAACRRRHLPPRTERCLRISPAAIWIQRRMQPAPGPRSYQPMNINFGLFPPLAAEKRRHGERLRGTQRRWPGSARSRDARLHDLDRWMIALKLRRLPPRRNEWR